jgi:SAM-dependent methyltransferase
MNSGFRQAAIIVALTTLTGIGFVAWITMTPPPERPVSASVTTDERVARANIEPRDPNAPFEPKVGQPGKDVVWVPTAESLVQKMLDLAGVTADDYLMDLGSGDGRTVIAAARRGATALGVEFNPDMVALSRKNADAAAVGNRARFVQGDLFQADLSKASVITMFLLPNINLRLRPKLLDLRPGTRIVSNSFNMGDWEPDATDSVVAEDCSTWCNALLWIVPAQVDGTWQLPDGRLILTQMFQKVEGTLDGAAITDVNLRADRLTFGAGSRTYSTTVNGDTMTGSGGGRSWTARRVARPPRTPPSDGVTEN